MCFLVTLTSPCVVFKISIRKRRISQYGYRAKLIRAFRLPTATTSIPLFTEGQTVSVKCPEDCEEICNQTVHSMQKFLLAGIEGELSSNSVIALNGTSLIRPWALVKKAVKEAFANQ